MIKVVCYLIVTDLMPGIGRIPELGSGMREPVPPTFKTRRAFEACTEEIWQEIRDSAEYVGKSFRFSKEDREDLAATAYARALKFFKQVPSEENRASFLHRIVHNEAINMYRFRQLHVVIDPSKLPIAGLKKPKNMGQFLETSDRLTDNELRYAGE